MARVIAAEAERRAIFAEIVKIWTNRDYVEMMTRYTPLIEVTLDDVAACSRRRAVDLGPRARARTPRPAAPSTPPPDPDGRPSSFFPTTITMNAGTSERRATSRRS